MTARADCPITYCKNILQKVKFIPITLCSKYLKSENEQKTSFLLLIFCQKIAKKHTFFIKFNSAVSKYAITLTKVSYEKYRTYVFFLLYPVWGIEESKDEVRGEGKKSSKPVFSYTFQSKEPPQTFVPKILVAYICSFKELHQAKPCQKPTKKTLKLIFHILYGLTSWTYEFG